MTAIGSQYPHRRTAAPPGMAPVRGGGAQRLRTAGVVLLAAALSACVVAPPPQPPPPLPPPPPPNVTVYAYPQQGQSAQQQDRDHYECSTWATKQTGFDPSAPNTPPHERVVVAGPPSGAGAAVGAFTGAVLGAAASRPRDAGVGMLIGALVGGAVGAGAEASANAQAQARAGAVVDARTRAQAAQIERRAADYRRALSACLVGRGYSIQ